MNKRILFIDDEQRELDALRRILHSCQASWEMVDLTDPYAAWNELTAGGFDLVVSDIGMPGMSGLELLGRIRQSECLKDIPVVLFTGLADRHLKRQTLDLGAADLLSKPVDPEELIARLGSVLRLKEYEDQLRIRNDDLEAMIRLRNTEMRQSRMEVIWRLGKAAEHRDTDTGNHVVRVGCISRIIAERLGCDRAFVEAVFVAAPLHDIGKIGIPDAILFKPCPLTAKEWAVMRQHCVIGSRILRDDAKAKSVFDKWLHAPDAFRNPARYLPELETAASIALTHHEKWDGSGYPQGLAGEQIPLEARIVAIADVFDALVSRRPYKAPYSPAEAVQIIDQGAGGSFDPQIHAAFNDALPSILSIHDQFADEAASPCLEREA